MIEQQSILAYSCYSRWVAFARTMARLREDDASARARSSPAPRLRTEVTFGTLLSVAGHAVNVLPWTQSATPRGAETEREVLVSHVLCLAARWCPLGFKWVNRGCGLIWSSK